MTRNANALVSGALMRLQLNVGWGLLHEIRITHAAATTETGIECNIR